MAYKCPYETKGDKPVYYFNWFCNQMQKLDIRPNCKQCPYFSKEEDHGRDAERT